jgi:polyhydroxybutyrate depolymerase
MAPRRSPRHAWLGAGLALGLAVTPALPAGRASATTPTAGGGDVAGRLSVGGRVRTYLVHRPPGFHAGLPVVLAFHGGGGTAAGMARLSGLDAVADAHGFVVVYPQGIGNSWAGGKGDTPADEAGVDDVGFVDALIDRLVAEDGIDPTRVFATGMSSGGFMTQRLGCELASRIAGIAPVAATLIETIAQTCAPGVHMPVLEIQGTADPLVPYGGGHVRGRGPGGNPTLAAPATIAHWASVNGCSAPPRTAALPVVARDGTRVRTDTYPCPGGPVVLYTVVGGGHTWPGGEQYLPVRVVGRTTRQFNASETIWAFFASLPPRPTG